MIANRTLAHISINRLFEYFMEYPHHAIKWLERFYPLTIDLIALYDRWEWEALSSNKFLPWSEELLARHEDKWDWWRL